MKTPKDEVINKELEFDKKEEGSINILTGNEEKRIVKIFRLIEMMLLILLITVPGWIAILESRGAITFTYETKKWIYYFLSAVSSTGIIYILFTRLRGHVTNEDDV